MLVDIVDVVVVDVVVDDKVDTVCCDSGAAAFYSCYLLLATSLC